MSCGENYALIMGKRVQNSVFECSVTPCRICRNKSQALSIIDTGVLDFAACFIARKNGQNRLETIDVTSYDPDIGVLLL